MTDLTREESGQFAATLELNNLEMVFLGARKSANARLRMIAEHASGFVYAVSRARVTEARKNLIRKAELLVTSRARVSRQFVPSLIPAGSTN